MRITPDTPTDLQLHTTYGDGRWSAEQLFDYLALEGFGLVAVTNTAQRGGSSSFCQAERPWQPSDGHPQQGKRKAPTSPSAHPLAPTSLPPTQHHQKKYMQTVPTRFDGAVGARGGGLGTDGALRLPCWGYSPLESCAKT